MTSKTKTKSSASSNTFLALSKPAFASETVKTPGSTSTTAVPDYKTIARESRDASINALNVASTSAVNAIKSIGYDRSGTNNVAAQFGDLLPTFAKEAKAGADYRNAYNRYLKNSNISETSLQEKLNNDGLTIKGDEFVELKTSQSLKSYALRHKAKEPGKAYSAMNLDTFASRQAELKFIRTDLRNSVHAAMQKETFNVNGQEVIYENCGGVPGACSIIKKQIDSGFYAWVEKNTDFGEKEIYNYIVYPNRKTIIQEETNAAIEQENFFKQEIDLANTAAFKTGLQTPNINGQVTVLAQELSLNATARDQDSNAFINDGAQLTALFETRLENAEFLLDEGEIDFLTAYNMIYKSGPIQVREGNKIVEVGSIAEYKPFRARVQKFLAKIRDIDSLDTSVKSQDMKKKGIAFSEIELPLLDNVTSENYGEYMVGFFERMRNQVGTDSMTFLSPQLQDRITRAVTVDNEGELTEYHQFTFLQNKGFYVDPSKFQHFTLKDYRGVSLRDKLIEQNKTVFSQEQREKVLLPFIERFTDFKLISQAYRSTGIDPGPEAANAEFYITQELMHMISSEYNNQLKIFDGDRGRALAEAVRIVNLDTKALFANPAELHEKIRLWANPGVGPDVVPFADQRLIYKNSNKMVGFVSKNDFTDIAKFLKTPDNVDTPPPTDLQGFLGFPYPNVAETKNVLSNLSEWAQKPINSVPLSTESLYWKSLSSATGIPIPKLAADRAFSLGLMTKDQYKIRVSEIQSSPVLSRIETSTNQNTEVAELTVNGEIDDATYNADVSADVTAAVKSGSIKSIYDYQSNANKPIIIDGKTLPVSEVTGVDLLKYLQENPTTTVGAYGISLKDFNNISRVLDQVPDFDLNQPFNEAQQKLFWKIMRLNKSNQAVSFLGADTTPYRITYISQEYAQLFSNNSDIPISPYNDPSSGMLTSGLIEQMLSEEVNLSVTA